jgi:DnaJ homolog subfamily A member 5
VEQDWQKIGDGNLGVADLEWVVAEGADSSNVFECVACGKSFKSEAAWDSHERSKKHLKAIEMLKREMEEEEEELGLGQDGNRDDNESQPEDPPPSPPQHNTEPLLTFNGPPDKREKEVAKSTPQEELASEKLETARTSEELLSTPERLARERRERPGATGRKTRDQTPVQNGETEEELPEVFGLSKKEKRRAREAAKKAEKDVQVIVRNVFHAVLSSVLTKIFAAGSGVMFVNSRSRAEQNYLITSETLDMH